MDRPFTIGSGSNGTPRVPSRELGSGRTTWLRTPQSNRAAPSSTIPTPLAPRPDPVAGEEDPVPDTLAFLQQMKEFMANQQREMD